MAEYTDREAAISALWNALFKYEYETEEKFKNSNDLDLSDWFIHRIFVQNMSNIDRQTILDLPTADVVEVVRCKDCKFYEYCVSFAKKYSTSISEDDYCSKAERRKE